MSEAWTFLLDGQELTAQPGQTIIDAADAAGIYIPRLCHKSGLEPFGGCRVCTVKANGRNVSACTQPVAEGLVVENDTEELRAHRKLLVEMLFVEGNHFCMSCEKSGNCELQALAYRLGIAAPRFEYMFPQREVDASHPDVWIDHNRCVLCARCVRTSRDVDGKSVFGVIGRGSHKRVVASQGTRLSDTKLDVTDQVLDACPVGALLRKRLGFTVPIGQREFDTQPIGAAIENEKE